ncbi:MAG: PAS domain S-box protein [Nanoarchaeota archaeon]|nr:PAS domain S-box protein [Nanoarchaeota archaeon]
MGDIVETLGDLVGKDRITQVFQELPIGFIISDAKGNIKSCNKRLERMLGYLEQEMIGKHESQFVFDEEEKRILEEQNKKRAEGKVSYYELRWKNSQGQRVDTGITAVPLYNQEGLFVGNSAFIKDVTKDKRIEQRIRITDKIKILKDTSGGAWHAIRNLSTSTMGYISLWLQHETDPEKRKQLEYMMGDQQKAMSIIDNFQTIAKPLAEEDKNFYDLNEILNAELNFLKISFLRNYQVDLELGKSVQVHIAKQRIAKEVLFNLVKNSSEAMGNSGTITIGTRIKDNFVEVYVRDTGDDIPQPDRAFELFFTTKETGSGIGLHVVKTTVKDHQGYVGLNTKPKEFYFALPLTDRNA